MAEKEAKREAERLLRVHNTLLDDNYSCWLYRNVCKNWRKKNEREKNNKN